MTGITYPPEMLPRQEDGDGEVWVVPPDPWLLPRQDDGDGEVWVVPPDDSYGCWLLGQAIYRERGVRAGLYRPVTEAECNQAAEGPVPVCDYDCVSGTVERQVGGVTVQCIALT